MSDDEALSQEALDALLAELGAADDTAMDMQAAAAMLQPDEDAVPDEDVVEDRPPVTGAPAVGGSAPSPLNLVSFDEDYGTGLEGVEGFERVQDIPLEITVELGRTRLLIRDILELGVGSIIELEKMAGEPVDLLANGLLIARGEVVVIEDNFGVRITEIITAADRSETLKSERNSNA